MKRNIGLTQAGSFDDVGDRPTLQPKTRHNKQSIGFPKSFFKTFPRLLISFLLYAVILICVYAHMCECYSLYGR
jgi:hypothetical protein